MNQPDFSGINLTQLFEKHEQWIRWQQRWSDYRLLYKGGDDFKRNTGTPIGQYINEANGVVRQQRRFLWQQENEEDVIYNLRRDRLFYIPYFRTIINTFKSWAFSQMPSIKPVDGEAMPDEAAAFLTNCDGAGTSLFDFARERFGSALCAGKGGWLLGIPEPVLTPLNQYEADQMGLSPCLTHYEAEEIDSWQQDASGNLLWVKLSKRSTVRASIFDQTYAKEIHTYVDRTHWAMWEVVGATKPADPNGSATATDGVVRFLGQGEHGLGEVPFVLFELPHDFWIGNLIADPCIDLFNKQNSLSYTQNNACFPQPVLTVQDKNGAQRVFGESHLAVMKAGRDGANPEKFEWVTMDIAPLQFSAMQIQQQKDELFRTVHQMSLAVDSNAVGAVGRSGASKQEDRRATEIILNNYGSYIRDGLRKTMRLFSKVMKTPTDWVVLGFDNFKIDKSLQEAALVAEMISKVPIESNPFQVAWKADFIETVLADYDEPTRQAAVEALKTAWDSAPDPVVSPIAPANPNDPLVGQEGAQPLDNAGESQATDT